MSFIIPKKPQILYAPMLGSLGGGSARGFGRGVGGGSLSIQDVFSTDLYVGAGDGQTITNGIDLAGEGGLVWGKCRNVGDGFFLVDSERGKGSNNNFKYLRSEAITAEQDISNRSLSSFNSNGFTFQGGDGQFNGVGNNYVSWSFRKSPRFFDCVQYTGDGSLSQRSIPHSLESTPGLVVIKMVDSSSDWTVGHTNAKYPYYTSLNKTASLSGGSVTGKGYISFSSSNFSVWSGGSQANDLNTFGASYVAYIFAHNNNDGGFGPSGDQDVIKAGQYAGNSSNTGPVVNLGFEPQWLLIKNVNDSNEGWSIHDNKRDLYNPRTVLLRANTNDSEVDSTLFGVDFTSTGFQIKTNHGSLNGYNQDHIYVAIRAAE
jgi:hypothetical protein